MTATEELKVQITCSVTGKTADAKPKADGSPSLPKGWKVIGDQVLCPDAVRERFAMRGVTLPVASVVCGYVGDDWSVEACKDGWTAFRCALRESCQLARGYMNWAFGELAIADRQPLEQGDKVAKLPKFSIGEHSLHLYQMGRQLFPALDSQSLSSLRQLVQQKYTQTRFERRVLGTLSCVSWRQDEVPLPIPKKDVRLDVNDQKQVFVRVRIGGEQFTLRLKNTPSHNRHTFYRQVESLRKVISGEAEIGDLKLKDRGSEVMATFACYLPNEPRSERTERVCQVETQVDKLFAVFVDGQDRPWNLNDDQIRKAITSHKARLHRLAEDSKFERRKHRHAKRTTPHAFREVICENQNNRLADYCHKAASMVVGLASRHRCGSIVYCDEIKDFAASFPWFKLRGLIEEKAKRAGISFVWIESKPKTAPQ